MHAEACERDEEVQELELLGVGRLELLTPQHVGLGDVARLVRVGVDGALLEQRQVAVVLGLLVARGVLLGLVEVLGLGARQRHVDGDPPIVHLEHVRLGARLVRTLAALELNERGAARTLQLAVEAQLQVLDCAELGESLAQRCLVRVEAQVAHKHGALLDHVQCAGHLFRLADLFRYDRGAFDGFRSSALRLDRLLFIILFLIIILLALLL